MAYDGFDYYSSQDNADIEYIIDQFEIQHYAKEKRSHKQKTKIPSYPSSRQTRTRKTQHPLVKVYGIHNNITSDIKIKIFPYTRYHRRKKNKDNQLDYMECDRYLKIKSKSSGAPHDFDGFRQDFYCRNHKQIKSSLKSRTDIEIISVRCAPIRQSVQNEFMKQYLKDTSFYPELVYHGTKISNIQSILDYGFLIPNQAHPTNTKAPKITVANGSAYGAGIYCSQTADYSLTYCNTVNTIFVCAAIPQRDRTGHIERSHGNIVVLSHVSEIIPLFLMDFRFVNSTCKNQTWFEKKYSQALAIADDPNRPLIISRKYLQKVLNCMKNSLGKRQHRRRGRRNNRRKISTEDEYQIRLFDLFVT